MSGGELTAVLVVLGVLALALTLLPAFLAFRKNHEFRFLILALSLLGPLTAYVTWIIAIIWVLIPKNKTVLDPLLSSGDGSSNVGDTAAGIVNNFQRGSAASSKLESRLKEIDRLHQSGSISQDEREELRRKAMEKGL